MTLKQGQHRQADGALGGDSGGQAVVYAHGFLSSDQSTKAHFFRDRLEGWPDVAFYAIDFNPMPRDFAAMTVTGQIHRLRQFLLDRGLVDVGGAGDGSGEGVKLAGLIGSSLGGLVSLRYADLFGGVERLLLLAPALAALTEIVSEEERARWEAAGAAPITHPAFGREVEVRYDLHADSLRYLEPVPPPAPTVIIHGRQDEHVPIRHSEAYASGFPGDVSLVEVDAGHDLNDHLDVIWQYVQSFVLQLDRG